MSTISEMMGLDKKIEQAVTDALKERGLTVVTLRDRVKVAVDAYAADLYSTMKSLEMYKYKFIELETKLDNLAVMVKMLQKGEGK